MRDYSGTVISVIDKYGFQENLISSRNDAKHLSAFRRLIEQMGFDKYGIENYINNVNAKGSVTGFEMAKFISSQGYVVFFHTDVHNYFNNTKRGSIMLPKDMTDEQLVTTENMLLDLIDEDFGIYMGIITPTQKGRRIIYQPGPRILPRVEENEVQYVK